MRTSFITLFLLLAYYVASATTLPQPCGECFNWYLTSPSSAMLDFSNTIFQPCSNEEYVLTWAPASNPDNQQTLYETPNLPPTLSLTNGFGDIIICLYRNCDVDNGEFFITEATEICCVVISFGGECIEPPICHFTSEPGASTPLADIFLYDAGSSSGVDYYSWIWDDFTSDITTSPEIARSYLPDQYVSQVCLYGTNACGMSKYCINLPTADEFLDCFLPFDPYNPPVIQPEVFNSTIQFDISSFACQDASVTFDPGDGTGEYAVSGCSPITYTYPPDAEGPYLVCIVIDFGCYSICFCYTCYPRRGYDCDFDPYELYCNEDGNEVWYDSNDPSQHSGLSVLSDIMDTHQDCAGIDDGCDESNTFPANALFEAHEVIYRIDNSANNNNLDPELAIDLIPDGGSNLDLELFVYSRCADGTGPYDCVASSTNEPGKREAVYIENAFEQEYYVVVDGWTSGNANPEGPFELSVTCGNLCSKDPRGSLVCGQSIIDSTTVGVTNNASYYCNCENESENGPAANYGPENVYVLTIIDTADVTITLDILTPNADLELYLLEECHPTTCMRNSRNPANVGETIQKTLTPGTYYVIVEGFRGDKGKYELSVDGCECRIDCPTSTTRFIKDFESYADGDTIPNPADTCWGYGSSVYTDPLDNSLAAVVQEDPLNQNKYLTLNYGNYGFSDVALMLPRDSTGVHKVQFDLTLQYVQGEGLYHGSIVFGEASANVHGHKSLTLHFGHDNNGNNFADLYLKTIDYFGIRDSIRLTSFAPLKDVPDVDIAKTFEFCLVYNIDRGIVSYVIDQECVYSGFYDLWTGYDHFSFLLRRNIDFVVSTEQGYMEIDNIEFKSCGACEDVYHPGCDKIFITGFESGPADGYAITFGTEDIPGESITGWEIIDEFNNDTIALSNGYWPGFRPGRTYKICVIYFDGNGCLRKCCITLTIPGNCILLNQDYVGNGNSLEYQYEIDDSSLDPVMFMNLETGETSSNGFFQFDLPGTYRICCLLYDPVLKTYILCCRTFCIDFPWPCSQLFTYNVIPGSTENRVVFTRNNLDAETYEWDFGNGASSNSSQQTVTYSYPPGNGSYTVCLTIWDPCRGYCTWCTDIVVGAPLMLDIGEECGAVGEVVSVPIRAMNFVELVTGSFTVNLTGNGAKIVGAQRGELTNVFVANVLDDRTVVVNWADANSNPLSLPNNSVIATIEVEITSPSFTETDLNFGTTPVGIKFTDQMNNAVPISIQNGSVCLDEQVVIAGDIHSVSQLPMPDVTVWRQGVAPTSTFTDGAGNYSLPATIGQNYTIEPNKTGDFLNGVNALDLILVLRHVSFVDRFDDPMQWLAGDVDQNGTVEVLDYKIINDALLGRISGFPGGASWRFLPTDYTFIDPSNPLPEGPPMSRSYQPLQSSVEDADFTGIKLGDVNHSALPLMPETPPILTRSTCDSLVVRDALLTAGEQVDLRFEASGFVDNLSFMVELKLDDDVLEFDQFISSDLPDMGEQSIGDLFIEDGYLHILWFSADGLPIDLNDGSNLFTLRFNVKKSDVFVREAMEITSTHRETMMVDGLLNENCIELFYDPASSTSSARLHASDMKVWPNPFKSELNIAIESSLPTEGELLVTDITGRSLFSRRVALNQGTNPFTITESDVKQYSGILLVQFVTTDSLITKKVVRTD